MSKYTPDQIRAKLNASSRKDWYQRIALAPGLETPGIYDCSKNLELMELPRDLSGLRVLDVGTAEGYFSFECERRGAAEVVATDYNNPEHTGFNLVADILGSRVRHQVVPMYEMSPNNLGTFDIVLFLGLLYHLPDPLLALRLVRRLCRDGALLFVESQILDRQYLLPDGQKLDLPEPLYGELEKVPLMQYFPSRTLNPQDATNFWAPNVRCLELMLADANFEVLFAKKNPIIGSRATLKGRAVRAHIREQEIDGAYGALLRT